MKTANQQQEMQLKKLKACFKRSLFRQFFHILLLRLLSFSKR